MIKNVESFDVWGNEIIIEKNGIKAIIHIYWGLTFKYGFEFTGCHEVLWLNNSNYLNAVLSEVFEGDGWARAILILISNFDSWHSRFKHAKHVAGFLYGNEDSSEDSNRKSEIEGRVLRGLWMSLIRWKNFRLSSVVKELLEKNIDKFENKSLVREYLKRFENPMPYIITNTLAPNQTTLV